MKSLRSLFIVLVLGICFFSCNNLATDSKDKNPEETPSTEQTLSTAPIAISPELAAAFDAELASAGLLSQAVNLNDIKSMQDKVLAAWKAANASDLSKLPSLDYFPDYHDNDNGVDTENKRLAAPKWTVPGLEGGTDYNMPFEYGWWSAYEPEPSESDPYPFCIYLHGSGDDRNIEWSNGNAVCNDFGNGSGCKGVFFNPRGPSGSNYNKWWLSPFQTVWEDLLRLALLQDYIDPKQIYIAGYSEGGYGTQRLASFYGDYFTGAAPMGCGEPIANAPPENLMYTNFYMLTGQYDLDFGRYKLTEKYREKVGELKNKYDTSGYNTKYKNLIPEQAGTHVEISSLAAQGFQNTVVPGSYVRITNPPEVLWEDFPMDGQRRVGFYNIQILERPDNSSDARTEYHVKITEGNNISLNVKNVTYTPTETYTDTTYEATVTLDYDKTYTDVTSGKIRIYLNTYVSEYPFENVKTSIDLTQPISVTVNGKTQEIQPTVSVQSMVDSVKAFFDPQRIYPAYIEVDLKP